MKPKLGLGAFYAIRTGAILQLLGSANPHGATKSPKDSVYVEAASRRTQVRHWTS